MKSEGFRFGSGVASQLFKSSHFQSQSRLEEVSVGHASGKPSRRVDDCTTPLSTRYRAGCGVHGVDSLKSVSARDIEGGRVIRVEIAPNEDQVRSLEVDLSITADLEVIEVIDEAVSLSCRTREVITRARDEVVVSVVGDESGGSA